jgi:hypothetical protein
MQRPTTHALTPGQATYIITTLLNERRLTTTDITTYLHQLHDDINAIEQRLATLRAAAPSRATRSTARNTHTPSNTTAARTGTPTKRRQAPATRAKRQLQGRYLGYMRQLPEHDKPRFKAIKARSGFASAITALRKHLGK